MKDKFDAIVAITDAFSEKYLDADYAKLIRSAVAALSRKRPSPIATGKPETWACGATHAIGTINFLFDKANKPYIGAKDLYKAFGVGQSTGQGKSKLIRDLLKMNQFDHKWSLPSIIDRNPMIWMISVNDYLIDARKAPREVQEIAFEKGLIPYIPEDRE